MRKNDLDIILTGMLESYPGISDLFFCVGQPLQVEAFGELKPVQISGLPMSRLMSFQTEQIALTLVGANRRLLKDLMENGSCDCGYSLSDRARFRINIFRQRGNIAIVMRRLQTEIPSISALGLPAIFREMAREKNGLILVTGATGNGKTTTLSAILNEINETRAEHIVTLEDPIEFVHPHKRGTFNQRELGQDFSSYPIGLRAALRQAPKVILIGEMRDRETVEIALTAAETGHLVLSTLHTVDAGQTINRVLGLFDHEEQAQVRLRLADTLRYCVAQRLAPKISGGRALLLEIMGANLRTREAIALGESENRTFYEITEASSTFGWMTFDQAIQRSFAAGEITEETARLYATKSARVGRMIDDAKKLKGLQTQSITGLKLDVTKTSR